MKKVAKGIAKVIVSYLAVILVIMLMPIFLITNDASMLDSVMDYIFDSKL